MINSILKYNSTEFIIFICQNDLRIFGTEGHALEAPDFPALDYRKPAPIAFETANKGG